MGDEKAASGGGQAGGGAPGVGKGVTGKSWYRKKSFIFIMVLCFIILSWYLYPLRKPDKSLLELEKDAAVLHLYDDGTRERNNILNLYRENLRFAKYHVEMLLIEIEKLQRTMPLDVRLAGLKAEFYRDQKKEDAIKEEEKRINAERAALRKLLDEAVKEVQRYTKLTRETEKAPNIEQTLQPKIKAEETKK